MIAKGAVKLSTKVSVIIPCYNSEKYLEEAVRSLISTAYPSLEIIIVDDGSSDASLCIAHDLAAKYSCIKVLQHERGANRGAGISRNVGFAAATGEYLAFLDADDYVLPERFTRAVQILDNSPSVDAVCGTTQKVVEHGGERRQSLVRNQTVFNCEDPDQVLYQRLFGGLAWSTNAILMRANIFKLVGGFSERPVAEDAVLWLKLASVSRIVSAGLEPICVYRIHAKNNSSASVLSDHHVAVKSHVISEVLQWAGSYPVAEEKQLLIQRALVASILNDNRRFRVCGQQSEALSNLMVMIGRHVSLMSSIPVLRCLISTLAEWAHLKRNSFDN